MFSKEGEEIVDTLNGVWVQEEEDSDQASMVFIDSDQQYLALGYSRSQEWFVWKSAYKTVLNLGPGIWIPIQNELLSSISSTRIWIAILDEDRIHITVDGNNQYYGIYTRLQNKRLDTPSIARNAEILTIRKQLDGLFTGPSGVEFFFSSPNFRLYDGKNTSSGVYYVYYAFAPVIELSMLDQGALINQQYQIAFTSEEQQAITVESLEFYPVEVTLNGLERLSADPIKVDRILESVNP